MLWYAGGACVERLASVYCGCIFLKDFVSCSLCKAFPLYLNNQALGWRLWERQRVDGMRRSHVAFVVHCLRRWSPPPPRPFSPLAWFFIHHPNPSLSLNVGKTATALSTSACVSVTAWPRWGNISSQVGVCPFFCYQLWARCCLQLWVTNSRKAGTLLFLVLSWSYTLWPCTMFPVMACVSGHGFKTFSGL